MPITPRIPSALAALLAAAALAAPASAAKVPPPPEPFGPVEIVPGITEQRIVAAGPQVVHVVRVKPGPLISIAPALTGGTVAATGTLTAAMRAGLAAGAVVGINGDALNRRKTGPDGLVLSGGEVMSAPDAGRTAMLSGAAGFGLSRLVLLGRYQAESPRGFSRAFSSINRPPQRRDETVVYTSRFGPLTPPPDPAGAPRAEAIVQLDANALFAPNVTLMGTVVATAAGGAPIGPGQAVISGFGATAATVSGLAIGRRVSIRLTMDGIEPGITEGLGGGPLLVRGGSAVPSAGESFSASQLTTPNARTALGQTADGTLLLVTAEGPQQHSVGFTVAEQAELMVSLGAVDAMAFDSGKFALMAVGDRLVLPTRAEPAIPNALVVSYRGVQLGQLPLRITPNGDGVDDGAQTTVRAPSRGQLTVTMVRADGSSSASLARGRFGPGAGPIAVNPGAAHLIDGPYLVTARFTPNDGSTPTEASRRVIVDRTLGFLRLRSTTVVLGSRSAPQPQLRIGFRLTRSARVTVLLRDSQGQLLTRLRNRALMKPGQRVVTWDRSIKGKRARPGKYTVEVEARTTLGPNTLTRSIELKSTRATPSTR
jgi:hypothetical protein